MMTAMMLAVTVDRQQQTLRLVPQQQKQHLICVVCIPICNMVVRLSDRLVDTICRDTICRERKEKVYAVRRDRETSDRPWRPVAALS